MFSWETPLTGLGFRFRSLLNWLVSCYALAVALTCCRVGQSGFENIATAAGFAGLTDLSRWVDSAYSALGAGDAPGWLLGLLLVWLALSCLVLGLTYSEGALGGRTVNLIPNCAFAAALACALCHDLAAPGWGWSLGPIALLVTGAAVAAAVRGTFWKNRLAVAGLALLGVLLTPSYAFLAPPLWLAGPDGKRLRDDAPDTGGPESAGEPMPQPPAPPADAPSPVRGLAKMEGGGRDGQE